MFSSRQTYFQLQWPPNKRWHRLSQTWAGSGWHVSLRAQQQQRPINSTHRFCINRTLLTEEGTGERAANGAGGGGGGGQTEQWRVLFVSGRLRGNVTERWRRFPNPFPALVCPHQALTTDLLVLIVFCYGGVEGGVEGGMRMWRVVGAHMPENDASPLICSSARNMNSSASRHTHTHAHPSTQSPAVWPFALFAALLRVCFFMYVECFFLYIFFSYICVV